MKPVSNHQPPATRHPLPLRGLPIMAALLTGFVLASPAFAQVRGVRSLPPACVAGELGVVELDLQVDGVTPNGVIVVETLPVGWTLQAATPVQNNYNAVTREIRWLFFGGSVNGDNMDIRYTVIAGDEPAPFTGSIRFNDVAGEPQATGMAGDAVCASPVVCTGDCNGDGRVTIDEVVRLVSFVLGDAVIACPAGDSDASGTITVDEVVTAVNNALGGCPSS
jgi:hypothetical protein